MSTRPYVMFVVQCNSSGNNLHATARQVRGEKVTVGWSRPTLTLLVVPTRVVIKYFYEEWNRQLTSYETPTKIVAVEEPGPGDSVRTEGDNLSE